MENAIKENVRKKGIFAWFQLVIIPIYLAHLLTMIIPIPYWWGYQIFWAFSVLVILGAYLFILRLYKYNLSDIGISKEFNIKDVYFALIFFVLGLLLWGLMEIVANAFELSTWRVMYSFNNPLTEIPVVILTNVLLIPVSFELIYRGFLMGTLNVNKAPVIVQILISQILFSLNYFILFGFDSGVFMLLWGIIPAILFVIRKNVYGSIIVNILNSFFIYIFLNLIKF